MQLKEKIAIVTGAASGIGQKIAETFAQEGAIVVIADLDETKAQNVAEKINADNGTAIALRMDVTDEASVSDNIEKVIQTVGNIDILVSNAGIQHVAPIDELTFADWKKLLAIQLDGAFLTTRACLRNMYAAKRGGSIIYMGSVHSKEGSALKAPYVTCKHGLIGLCKVVTKEGAQHGVRANVICPGYVRTPLVEKQIPQQAQTLQLTEEEVVRTVMLKNTVDGEFTTSSEIADVAVFLASFKSLALTGQSIVVSHGWHMQ